MGLPAQPFQTALTAFGSLFNYLFHHPSSYYYHREDTASFELVRSILLNSAVLLLLAMLVALIIGICIGLAAVLARGKTASAVMVVLSILGMSTPSFLLAMLLWIFNIYFIHRFLGLNALPQTGFGWDLHLIMPALVLSVRPLAQIAQVTYLSLSDVMGQDFIRTARSKGLSQRLVYTRHALRNVMIPVMTTAGTSLRYSLASLPVVELFFYWPGVGLALLQSLDTGNTALITDLIVSLGLFFLFFNLVLDLIYPFIDPRLRKNGGATEQQDAPNWRDFFRGMREFFSGVSGSIRRLLSGQRKKSAPLPPLLMKLQNEHKEEPIKRQNAFLWGLRLILNNPSFLIGSLLVAGLLVLVVFGERLTPANPFQMHGVEKIDGVIGSPPFSPSPSFPWGSDHIGRDIQAFVFAGAKRTMLLAFFAMLARMGLGSLLGVLAGWWQDSWFDRLVSRLMSIWAAFPITLFAMILIQAIGIQQGMSTFIIALCVIGWGEVTQFVRAQTIRIKPQLYIEAARALGARPAHLLAQQVFPNLVPSLIIIAALEMGGILLLLAELGFLDIFLGGGFLMEISVDKVIHFSDIPEWGAMLANIRQWWRAYPWLAWYPGVAFFLAIIAFNLFGEGLRHFIEESRVNLSRLFNRRTLMVAVAAVVLISMGMQSIKPINTYRKQAQQFNAQNAMADIQALTQPEMAGRELGTEGNRLAAEYIARRMKEVGLFPGNIRDSYYEFLP